MNDFALFVSLEELQQYGDQLLTHWKKEHDDNENNNNIDLIEEDELAPPVIRRARHLSIDKHSSNEIDIIRDNGDERVHKRPSIP